MAIVFLSPSLFNQIVHWNRKFNIIITFLFTHLFRLKSVSMLDFAKWPIEKNSNAQRTSETMK